MKASPHHRQQASREQLSPASLHMKASLIQRKSALGDSARVQRQKQNLGQIQNSARQRAFHQQQQPLQRRRNNTGLPDNLKSGVENLSGYSMDDVRVHYNSDKPAQLQAHAYAQGTDIHLGPGQEKHLPHEAWHVVQQKQGRVRPTMQMKGKVNVNDDVGLEREADVMGARAMDTQGRSPQFLSSLKRTASRSVHQPTYKTVQRYEFSEEQMARFSAARRQHRTKELEHIRALGAAELLLGPSWVNRVKGESVIHVGVSFRTDSRGVVHETHDTQSVIAMNRLGLPFRVVPVTLPRGAKGGVSPIRNAGPGELRGIDLLYIPGGPTANDTQVGETPEDRDFNRVLPPEEVKDPGKFTEEDPGRYQVPEDQQHRLSGLQGRDYGEMLRQIKEEFPDLRPGYLERRDQHRERTKQYEEYLKTKDKERAKYDRLELEHRTRAKYELDLVRMARTRGIPILSVCAGSWRLLQAFGGRVKTLPQDERSVHKYDEDADYPDSVRAPEGMATPKVWRLNHPTDVYPETDLESMMNLGPETRDIESLVHTVGGTNSTHWAVADEEDGDLAKATERGENPNDMLHVSARASLLPMPPGEGQPLYAQPTEDTVEAFETKRGAPQLGIQWHPESYLPGMDGEAQGSKAMREGSRGIFKSMAIAAHASKGRSDFVTELRNRKMMSVGHLRAVRQNALHAQKWNAGMAMRLLQQKPELKREIHYYLSSATSEASTAAKAEKLMQTARAKM